MNWEMVFRWDLAYVAAGLWLAAIALGVRSVRRELRKYRLEQQYPKLRSLSSRYGRERGTGLL